MGGAELMRTITSAFEEGDVRPLMAAIHPDVVWKSASKYGGLFSFGGKHMDRIGVVEVLSKIALRYTFTRFRPKEIVEQGDMVWGLFDTKLAYKPPKGRAPKSVTIEIAIRWKLCDGKIVEHQAFFDTASVLVQQGMMRETLITRP
jgi:ketosteroid isomerase-like protein